MFHFRKLAMLLLLIKTICNIIQQWISTCEIKFILRNEIIIIEIDLSKFKSIKWYSEELNFPYFINMFIFFMCHKSSAFVFWTEFPYHHYTENCQQLCIMNDNKISDCMPTSELLQQSFKTVFIKFFTKFITIIMKTWNNKKKIVHMYICILYKCV